MKLLVPALATLLLAAPPAQARRPSSSPTFAQIRAAVNRAEHSSKLWATINVCNSAHHPDAVGIRGQMPALGFPARLRMVFRVDYWTNAAKGDGFTALPGLARPADDGIQRGGTWQTGILLRFAPHTGLVRGRVIFEWRIGGRIIGRLQTVTESGHVDAAYGDPKGFSSWRCRLP